MLSLFDPTQSRPLLVTTRQGWGQNYYEQRSVELDGRPARQLVFRRNDDAPAHVPAHVWLDWTALDRLAGLSVDIHGSGSGARLYLDCLDASGWGLRFNLGADQAAGWRTYQLDPGDIAASWGACSSKRGFDAPLQPVALVVEDHENRGAWTLGLGAVTAQAQAMEPRPAQGAASCQLNRHTLSLDLQRGGQTLLHGLALSGELPGKLPRDFRTLSVRNAQAVAHGHYSAELACGEVRLPLEVKLEQLSSAVWIARYELLPRAGLEVVRLDVRASLGFRAVQGLSYGTDEEWLGELDGRVNLEPVLAEPAIWEPLAIGAAGAGRLRIKADGPVLKTLQLLDLRAEEGLPEYALQIVVAYGETYPEGAPLKFGVLLDTGS